MGNYTPITEKFLTEGKILSLMWHGGLWSHMKIRGFSPLVYDPYSENWTIVDAGGTMDAVVLDTNENKEIPNIPSELAKHLVIHLGLGLQPRTEELKCFPEYPSGDSRAKWPNLDPITTQSRYGYFTGEDSPFHEPTDAAEFFITHGVDLALGFRNDDAKDHLPCVNMLGRLYYVDVLNPKTDDSDLVLAYKLVQKKAMRDMHREFVMGSLVKATEFPLSGHWPKPLTDKFIKNHYVARIGGGR